MIQAKDEVLGNEALLRRIARRKKRELRKSRAEYGWFNWYLDRGRLPFKVPCGRELRMISWRRVF